MRITVKAAGLFLFLLAAAGNNLFSQKVDAALAKLIKEFPDEKAHLHIDKDYYLAGETIWFKGYLYGNIVPSTQSFNFFVQLLDQKGKVISESHTPVAGATSSGTLKIPDTIARGYYWLRAFTPWMVNFGEDHLYRHPIYIVSSFARTGGENIVANQSPLNIQFFAESGQLLDGIVSTLAFKATDGSGLPVMVEGKILSAEGVMIAPFKTYHNGMGKMQFKPTAGQKYSAEVQVGGKPVKFPLPEVAASGVNLKVVDEKGGKMFQVSRAEKNKDEFNELHLVVVQNKLIVYETEIAMEDYLSVRGHLLTNELPTGILQFVLFNKKGIPLAQRLSFVNNGEYKSDVDLNLGTVNLGKRQKSSFELVWPDSIQKSLSVSVTDANFGLPAQENIYTRFLLTSDIKGKIYNPAWYFTGPVDSTQQAMDLLMLTNGWTRYRWEKILNDEFPSIMFQDQGIMKISGQVMDLKGKDLMQGGDLFITLESPGMPKNSYEIPVSAAGRFVLDSMLLFGNTRVSYEYFNAKGKLQEVKLVPDETRKPNFRPDPVAASSLPQIPGSVSGRSLGSSDEKIIEEFKVLPEVQLKPVQKKATDSLNTNERYASGAFAKDGRLNFDFIKEPPKTSLNQNILDYLRQNIPQIEYTGSGFVSRKNFSLGTGAKWPVNIFLDNATTTPNMLRGLTVSDIALIKFYETGFFGTGTGGSGGTIALFSKKGNDLNAKEAPERILPFFMVDGYSAIKEFYRQDPLPTGVGVVPPDQSTTLYWNPAIIPSGDEKKINIEFYNNDISKRIRVLVEGFDAAGKMIHIEKWIDK